MRSGYPQMDASLYLRSRDFLRAARCQLDRFVVRPLVANAELQDIGDSFWKKREDLFPHATRYAQVQFPAEHRSKPPSLM